MGVFLTYILGLFYHKFKKIEEEKIKKFELN